MTASTASIESNTPTTTTTGDTPAGSMANNTCAVRLNSISTVSMTIDERKETSGREYGDKPIAQPPVRLDANKEFIAYGLANFVGAFFQTQLVSASFSRSALNFEMGGHTQLSSLIQAVVCLLCLLLLMPLLSYLPHCVLASVVSISVYRLITNGAHEAAFLYRVSRIELIEFVVAFLVPLGVGLEIGIFIAMSSSIVVNLYNTHRADISELGQVPSSAAGAVQYVDLRNFEFAKRVDEAIVILELRAECSFANYKRLIERIQACVQSQTAQFIVISFAHTQQIDSTAFRHMMEFFDDCVGTCICLAHCKKPVRDMLYRYQHATKRDALPNNVQMFIGIQDAVAYCLKLKAMRHALLVSPTGDIDTKALQKQ